MLSEAKHDVTNCQSLQGMRYALGVGLDVKGGAAVLKIAS